MKKSADLARITVPLSSELAAQLRILASASDRSQAAVIRMALRRLLLEEGGRGRDNRALVDDQPFERR